MEDFETRTAPLVSRVERVPQPTAAPDHWLPDLSQLTFLAVSNDAAYRCAHVHIINCLAGKLAILAAADDSCTIGSTEPPALLRHRKIDPHIELLALLDQWNLYQLSDDERFSVIRYFAEHDAVNTNDFFRPFDPPTRKGRGWIQDVRVQRSRTTVVIYVIQGKNRYATLTADTSKALEVLGLTLPPRGKYTTGNAFIVDDGIEAAYRLVPSIVDRLVETGGMHCLDGEAIKQRAFV